MIEMFLEGFCFRYCNANSIITHVLPEDFSPDTSISSPSLPAMRHFVTLG